MFTKTLFVVLFAALFASQGCVEARSPVTIESRSFTDTISKIKDLFDSLIQESTKLFLNMVQEINDFANVLIEETKRSIVETITNIDKSITILVTEAKELGVNVETCISSQKEMFEDLLKEAQEDLKLCVTVKIEEAKAFVNKELDLIRADIEKLEKDWANCNGIFCSPVLVDAGEMLVKLPSRVKQIKEDATALFHEIKEQVPTCIKGKATQAIEDARNIEKTIKTCIQDEIQKVKA